MNYSVRAKSFLHQYLETVKKYQIGNVQHDKKLQYLERGYLGEQQLDEAIELAQLKHAMHYKNMYLDLDGMIEIDSLLIFQNHVLLLDAKNYYSHVQYDKGVWYFNQKMSHQNILHQLERARVRVDKLIQNANLKATTIGKLYFANPYYAPSLDREAEEKSLLPENIVKYLKEFDQHINFYSNQVEIVDLIQQVQHHTEARLYMEEEYVLHTEEISVQLRCMICYQVLNDHNQMVICPYGHTYSKQLAALDLIHDYGVLHYNKPIEIPQVKSFCGNQLSYQTIYKAIDRALPLIRANRPRQYQNPHKILDKHDCFTQQWRENHLFN